MAKLKEEQAHLAYYEIATGFFNQSELRARGCLRQIPPQLLTEKMVAAQNRNGDTPVHAAADREILDQIPEGLLTPAVLDIPEGSNWSTAIHVAAEYNGVLSQIPPQLLTRQMFAVEDKIGRTPIHLAAVAGTLDEIPAGLFSTDLLTIDNDQFVTPIDEAVQRAPSTSSSPSSPKWRPKMRRGLPRLF